MYFKTIPGNLSKYILKFFGIVGTYIEFLSFLQSDPTIEHENYHKFYRGNFDNDELINERQNNGISHASMNETRIFFEHD